MADLRLFPTHLRAFGRRLPCTIGKGGVRGEKREGDGATPRGLHRIVGCLYRADRLAPPAPWAMAIGPGDLWCDAPEHPDYNQFVRRPFAASAERMARADPLYDVVLLTDWNLPEAAPGAGPAIFLHRWRRPGYPTEGCIALSPRAIRWLAARAEPGTTLRV